MSHNTDRFQEYPVFPECWGNYAHAHTVDTTLPSKGPEYEANFRVATPSCRNEFAKFIILEMISGEGAYGPDVGTQQVKVGLSY